jgi:hypothetical protein
MRAEQNELLTRVGPGSACGAVLRRYWQPVALVDDFARIKHAERLRLEQAEDKDDFNRREYFARI